MPGSDRRPSPTSGIAICSPRASAASASRSICRRRWATTPTTRWPRRGRARRRRHRFDRRHGGAVRPDSARPRVDLDDDQRDRDHPARAVSRGRAAAGCRGVGALGHDPERHPQGVRRARHLHLPAARVAAHRHRHFCVLRARAAELEHDFDQRLSHPRSRIDGGAGSGVHALPTRSPTSRRRSTPGSTSTRSDSGCRSSSTRTTTFSRRSRSSGRRGGCGRGSCAIGSGRPTRAPSSSASTPRRRAAR